MPQFRYRAVAPDGAHKEGVLDADSAQQVTAQLVAQGCQVNQVEEIGRPVGLIRLKPRLSWEDLDAFNQQLLAITKSGLPLVPALHAMARDLKSGRLRDVVESLRSEIERGSSLEEALKKHPDCFSPIYLSAVRAGERAGNLSGVLSYLADYSSRMLELQKQVQESLAYPLLVVMVAGIVFAGLLLKVVPIFAEIFQNFGARLPALTMFWINVSESVSGHGLVWLWILVCVLGSAIILPKALRSTPNGRYVIDSIKLRLPLLGPVHSSACMARFSRTLGFLLASEVPVGESLTLAAAASGNAVLEEAVSEAARLVEGGEKISDALGKTGRFGHSFCWIVSNAEERGGDVRSALFSLADSYDKSVARMDRVFRMLMAPLVILLVGGVILLLVLSLYLPMFTLADAVSGG